MLLLKLAAPFEIEMLNFNRKKIIKDNNMDFNLNLNLNPAGIIVPEAKVAQHSPTLSCRIIVPKVTELTQFPGTDISTGRSVSVWEKSTKKMPGSSISARESMNHVRGRWRWKAKQRVTEHFGP